MRRARDAQNRAAPSLERMTHRPRSERAPRRPAIFRTSEVLIRGESVAKRFLNCWIAGAISAACENAWRQAMTQAPSEDLA